MAVVVVGTSGRAGLRGDKVEGFRETAVSTAVKKA